jgi:formylglycine-generating enzyme required for sulfatase activity
MATFDLYERILNGKHERDQTTLAHAELKLSGLVKRDTEGCLVARNRIYKRLFDLRWIASSKPRRTLVRYRQWALAASLLLVIVIVVMGAFFWWASVREYPPGIAVQGLLVRVGLLSAIEPEMLQLQAGSFQMGASGCRPNNKRTIGASPCPQHIVTVPTFWMGKHEVTFAEYDRFAVATGRHLPSDNGWGRGAQPVFRVSWEEAKAYANWLSEVTGKPFRLPTEAEWEYAARAGTTSRWFFGDDKDKIVDYAWFYNNSGGKAHPVGQKKPNSWGLYDMHGNVREWVEDDGHDNYDGAPTDGTAWIDEPRGLYRIHRDCSYLDGPWRCYPSIRYKYRRNSAHERIGFRLAMTVALGS